MKKIRLVIEASALAESRISGIGHMTLETIKALERHPDNQKTFDIVLAIPFDKKAQLPRWGFTTVTYRSIPLPLRIQNLLWKFDLLPPMDLILGRGTYLFPNYKNWRLAFSKSFTYICDIVYLLHPQYVSPKNQKFMERYMLKWIKRADKVLAISEDARTAIVDNLPVKVSKTLLVPCGVDLDVFRKSSADEIKHMKKKLGLDKDYLLYLGNLEPRKNITGLIDGYKQLPEAIRAKYTLLLVGGGGWLNASILDAISKAQAEGFDIKQADVYIPEDELPALHSGATALVHPAFYEGFGISPLQAMACGTPVIVADNSSLPEVVGKAGLYVNATDSSDIADKLEELLSNKSLREKLSKAGVEQAQKYSWQNSADIIVKALGA